MPTARHDGWRPIKHPAQFNVMFWLPPGGTDDGVWAGFWPELADLEPRDVGPVLTLLAEARVGGDVPTPGGRARRDAIRRLWVDSLQYHRAEDVLITYPHGRIRSGWSSSAVWSRATDVLRRRIHFLQQGYVQGSVGHHDDAVVEPRVDPGGPIGERAYRVGAKIRGTARRTGPGD